MQTGGFQNHPLMRMTLAWTMVFAAGFWVTNAAMYFKRMSLTPASVQAYYLGSAEEYSQPRSSASMVEVSHAHLATMGVMMLLLTHLAIFAPWSDRVKRAVIGLGFGSALLGEASSWLVRFVSPGFAILKIACFLALQSVLAFLIAVIAVFLFKASRAHPRRASA